jgi:hypothetical protein
MTSITSRRWISWGKDAGERAVKTFAQAVLASAAITEGIALDAFYDSEVWSIGAAAAVISLLSSLASKRVGVVNTASVLPKDKAPAKPFPRTNVEARSV